MSHTIWRAAKNVNWHRSSLLFIRFKLFFKYITKAIFYCVFFYNIQKWKIPVKWKNWAMPLTSYLFLLLQIWRPFQFVVIFINHQTNLEFFLCPFNFFSLLIIHDVLELLKCIKSILRLNWISKLWLLKFLLVVMILLLYFYQII